MNYFRVQGALINGLQVFPVQVECAHSRRLPFLQIIGGSGTAVAELRERVIAALDACRIRLPGRRITVQFQPGVHGFPLESLDLAVAVAILGSCGQVPPDSVQGLLVCGGVGLDGSVRSLTNRAALRRVLQEGRFRSALLSWNDSSLLTAEQIGSGGGFRHLQEILSFLRGQVKGSCKKELESEPSPLTAPALWRELDGQEVVKRLIEIAAAGSHHLLLCGPTSARPELLAEAMSSLLPALEKNEAEEVTSIYSLAGIEKPQHPRPFLSFGSSLGLPPLLSDRRLAKVEEVLLAHRGVLFLDRVGERQSEFFRLLQQPMLRGTLQARMGSKRVEVPAEILVLAHGAACNCGSRGDPLLSCTCRPTEVRRYQERWKRLLRFPFDLSYSLNPAVSGNSPVLKWETCRQRVENARARMIFRQGKPNSRLFDAEIFENQPWSENAYRLWNLFHSRVGGCRLRVVSLAKIALTICDLREGTQVEEVDLLEAKHYFGEALVGEPGRWADRSSVPVVNSNAIP